MALFADREDAGRALAAALVPGPDAVVYGIPRGGVVVAAEVARAHSLPLDCVAVRKLGAPMNPEVALGAIAEDVLVISPEAQRIPGLTNDQFQLTKDMEQAELTRRARLYRALSHDPAGREAIVVDDGVATGATAVAACLALERRGASRVVLAVPVAPEGWSPGEVADEYLCLSRRDDFLAVGQFYDEFDETSDGEVLKLLDLT
ncbi:phosphoribosyltransferase [Microbacterium karelineae]|uniref:phosphoribosyltransferase n=1 Tax=Microbacterium karelineae TaxID=2654283 RepID=UPI0012EA619A|nr:phosphoribosyltransferase family protein [Microbacterium karelineae]